MRRRQRPVLGEFYANSLSSSRSDGVIQMSRLTPLSLVGVKARCCAAVRVDGYGSSRYCDFGLLGS